MDLKKKMEATLKVHKNTLEIY